MPVNIAQDNSAQFVVEFIDSSGNLTVPSSGDLTISYTGRSSNITALASVTLTQINSFFTGTWSSSGAALGLATWVLTAAGSTAIQATGQLRVIDRVSS